MSDTRIGIAPEIREELAKKVTATTVANQEASIATTAAGIVTDFNALLAKLKASGIMAADEE